MSFRSSALIEAGKAKLKKRTEEKYKQEILIRHTRKYDGATALALAEQNAFQSVMIHRSEQTWDTAKQLRSIKNTVRKTMEREKNSLDVLTDLEQKILDLRELTFENDLDEESVNLIKRGKQKRLVYADNEIDAKLAFQHEPLTSSCPVCLKVVLVELLHSHIKSCSYKKEIPEVDDTGILDEAGIIRMRLEQETKEECLAFQKKVTHRKHLANAATTTSCKECGLKILISRLDQHMTICRQQQLDMKKTKDELSGLKVAEENRLGITVQRDSLKLMVPQPPRNFKLVNVGIDYLSFSWDPPIFMGFYGVNVHDYVIDFSIRRRTRVGKKELINIEPQETVRTSCFCIKEPVCARGYILSNLAASTEYVDISVRAVNKVGFSQPSIVIPCAKTDRPGNPTAPQLLHLVLATSTTLSFIWSAPVNTGGGIVTHYEFSYSYMVATEHGKRMKTFVERLPVPQQCVVLSRLPGSTSFNNISVVAVAESFVGINKIILSSEPSNMIDCVKTLIHTREEKLRHEIRRVSTVKSFSIDSDVYAGFQQRHSTADLLTKLSDDLRIVKRQSTRHLEPKTQREIVATRLLHVFGLHAQPDALHYRQTNSMKTIPSKDLMKFGNWSLRKKQFEFRIQAIEERMESVSGDREDFIMRRSLLTKSMEGADRRIGALLAEHDRVSAHTGKFIDSNVMHGRMQRFPTDALKGSIEEEMKQCNLQITESKQELIAIASGLTSHKKELADLEMQLKDRKARLVAFENEMQRNEKTVENLNYLNWDSASIFFYRWHEHAKNQKRLKTVANKCLKRYITRDLALGWNTWLNAIKNPDPETDSEPAIGVGSQLLSLVKGDRTEMNALAAEILFNLRGSSQQLKENSVALAHKRALRSSPYFNPEEEENLKFQQAHPGLFAKETLHLNQGQAYLDMGNYKKSYFHFEKHANMVSAAKLEGTEDALSIPRVTQEQCNCFYGMGASLMGMKNFDKALVMFERSKSLALEVMSEKMAGLSLLGMGECSFSQPFYKIAIDFADRALMSFEDLNDFPNQALALRILERSYGKMFDEEKETEFRLRADFIEFETKNQLASTFKVIESAERKMINITADTSQTTPLEIVSHKVPLLRKQIEEKRLGAEDTVAESVRLSKDQTIDKQRLTTVTQQLEIVNKCTSEIFDSDLIHGIMQRFQTAQLKLDLETQKQAAEQSIEERTKEMNRVEIRIGNKRDDIHELEQELAVEVGPLMRKIIKSRQQFRYCALNRANLRSRDVTGMASGGVEQLICVVKDAIYVFDTRDGALLGFISGAPTPLDTKWRKKLDKDPETKLPGHFGNITSLLYFEHDIISGGVDMKVRVFEDSGDFRCKFILEGHTGSVWSLWADSDKIISGSSDRSVRIWSPIDGSCLHVLDSLHQKSVSCLDCDLVCIATGSPDCEVKIWPLHSAGYKSKVKRFIGHGCAISCVKMNSLELVSAGLDGRVIVWDTRTMTQLCCCIGHTVAIKEMQIDSTKLVTASIDKTVCVFDISTGQKILTLRGHEAPVLAMQFDSYRLLTVDADGISRLWYWSGDTLENIPAHDKMHIFKPGESLSSLEKVYGSSVLNIMKWNEIHDVGRTVYVGMRLIVKKANY